MKPSLRMTVAALLVCLALASPAAASSLIANFDSLAEGAQSPIFTDGGITFSDLDIRLPGEVGPYSFIIESTTTAVFGPLFSPPNYLKAGLSFAPGLDEGFSLGRFGSMRITFEQPAVGASLNVLSGFDATNVLTLNALWQGSIVGSTTIGFSSIVDFQANTLSLSGVLFDELRLVASGPQQSGTVFIGVDNVRIETASTVSEPSTISLLVICFATLGLRAIVRAE